MTLIPRDWTRLFPQLAELDNPAQVLLSTGARQVSLPAGTVLFQPGSLCENYSLILEGQVRIQKVSASGREIVLYRVEPGQACILTTVCLIQSDRYSAEGVTESDVRAIIIPRALFHRLLACSDAFRQQVFSTFSSRIADLLVLIEEVAFGRIDVRLAGLLLDKAKSTPVIALTHQELAVELGTAREVISRQLKDFERRGWVGLGRGRITLTDSDALDGLAGQKGSRKDNR